MSPTDIDKLVDLAHSMKQHTIIGTMLQKILERGGIDQDAWLRIHSDWRLAESARLANRSAIRRLMGMS